LNRQRQIQRMIKHIQTNKKNPLPRAYTIDHSKTAPIDLKNPHGEFDL